MMHFCTCITHSELPQLLAQHASLQRHSTGCHVTVLCLDAGSRLDLDSRQPAGLRTLTLDCLGSHMPWHARDDYIARDLKRICAPHLIRHLLPRIPPGARLTFVSPTLFLFASPTAWFEADHDSSVTMIGTGDGDSSTDHHPACTWISIRHDRVGLAYADFWVRQSAQSWPCTTPNLGSSDRIISPKGAPLTSDVAILRNTAALAAPANLGTYEITPGPGLGGKSIVAFDFGDLRHLGRQLYDSGLAEYGRATDPMLRQWIYQPYLNSLVALEPSAESPDLIPPSDPADPRIGPVLTLAVTLQRQAEQAKAAAEERAEKLLREYRRLAEEARARESESERYLRQVEQDRDQQRQSYFATRQRLEEVHQDLLHNIAYLKKLESEAEAQKQAATDRETYVSGLKKQLSERQTGGGSGPDLAALHQALMPYGHELQRVLVARYHPALLPVIFSLAAQGVTLEVLDSPAEFAGTSRGSVHFLRGNLWDWLGGLDSHFDESAYLSANADVAAAINSGAVSSGWDHYQRFGQLEGRSVPQGHRAGLADFDAVAFDSSDAGPIVPCLIGRLNPHHRIFVSNSFNPATIWLPGNASRTIVLGDLLCCPRPPSTWIGPRIPAALPVPHRSAPSAGEVFPSRPCQPADWPKISVVTAVDNDGAKLEETLRSVLSQHYPGLEYLVVDAASTDASLDVIHRHADKLAWWTSEPSAGRAAAIQKGLAKSTGELLVWLNPGDRLEPGSLYTVAQQFLLHAPDLVAGRCLVTEGDQTTRVQRSVMSLGTAQPLPQAELQDWDGFWRQDAFFRQPAIFLARKSWDRAGATLRTDLREGYDYELWLRLANLGARVLPIPEILASQVGRPTNLAELRVLASKHSPA